MINKSSSSSSSSNLYSQEGEALVKEIKISPSTKKTFYYYTTTNQSDNDQCKFNIVKANDGETKRITSITRAIHTFILSVFLPAGYPESVSDDYLSYQTWNCMQDFSNSITRTMATHAVLKGAGVGDAAATPMAATITWLMKDATGMISSISFAYLQGSKFDSDSKKWRLFADVINDLSYLFDLLSSYVAFGFTLMQCISSLIKSLVGVAGGATRASLVQHQARANNMADICAKDGSQETFTNLVALIVSLILVPLVAGDMAIVWTLYFLFAIFHLYSNYRGIRCLKIPLFNLSRFGHCVDQYLKDLPYDVNCINDLESVWFFQSCKFSCKIKFGLPLSHHTSSSDQLKKLTSLFYNDSYILSIDWIKKNVLVSFRTLTAESNVPEETFKAALHALIVYEILDELESNNNSKCPSRLNFKIQALVKFVTNGRNSINGDSNELMSEDEKHYQLIVRSKKLALELFPTVLNDFKEKGWDLTRCLISRGDWMYQLL